MNEVEINGSTFTIENGGQKIFDDESAFRLEYDRLKYNFSGLVAHMLDLESLIGVKVETNGSYEALNVTKTKAHELFYKAIHEKTELGINFMEAYIAFMNEFKDNFALFNFFYQRIPSFRVQMPGDIAVPRHCDYESDNDSPHKLPPDCISLFVPLSEARQTTAIQTKKGPIEGKDGNAIVWDGSHLEHWNNENITNQPRFSFDVKILPEDKYDSTYPYSSVNMKMPFLVGDEYYFQELR